MQEFWTREPETCVWIGFLLRVAAWPQVAVSKPSHQTQNSIQLCIHFIAAFTEILKINNPEKQNPD